MKADRHFERKLFTTFVSPQAGHSGKFSMHSLQENERALTTGNMSKSAQQWSHKPDEECAIVPLIGQMTTCEAKGDMKGSGG